MARFVDAISWIAENTDPGDAEEYVCVAMVASLWRKNAIVLTHDVERYRETPSHVRFTPGHNPTAP